jgi:flagellar biogenesis protein FliO
MTDFWLRYLLALAVVALMLGGLGSLGRFLRRGHVAKAGRRMEIVESLILSPQATLHLVKVDGDELLVGTGPAQISCGSRLRDIASVPKLLDGVEAAIGEVEPVVESDRAPLRYRR